MAVLEEENRQLRRQLSGGGGGGAAPADADAGDAKGSAQVGAATWVQHRLPWCWPAVAAGGE